MSSVTFGILTGTVVHKIRYKPAAKILNHELLGCYECSPMLPFGKWFLDRKRKKTSKEEKNNQRSPWGSKVLMSHMASQCLSHCALFYFILIY